MKKEIEDLKLQLSKAETRIENLKEQVEFKSNLAEQSSSGEKFTLYEKRIGMLSRMLEEKHYERAAERQEHHAQIEALRRQLESLEEENKQHKSELKTQLRIHLDEPNLEDLVEDQSLYVKHRRCSSDEDQQLNTVHIESDQLPTI